jgi:hypothetical protein
MQLTMAHKQYDHLVELIVVPTLESVSAGYVAIGAKADGLYQRKYGVAEQRLLTVSDIDATVEAFAGLPAVNGYVLASTTAGVRSWIPAAGINPLDDVFRWDGTKYTPYSSSLAGKFDRSSTRPTDYTTMNYNGVLNVTQLWTSLTTSLWKDQLQIGTYGAATYPIAQLSSKYGNIELFAYTNASGLRTTPIYIGCFNTAGRSDIANHNEYIAIDDYSQRFDINMTKIRYNKGTAAKWLALDANKEVIYMDAYGWDLEYLGGDDAYHTTAITSGRVVKFVNAYVSLATGKVTVTIPDFQLNSAAVKTLARFTSDESNVGNAYTDAFLYSLPANTLAQDGNALEINYGGVGAANANMKIINFMFGTGTTGDFLTSASAANIQWSMHITLIRTSSSTIRYTIISGWGQTETTRTAEWTSVDFTITNDIKLTLKAPSSNELTAKIAKIVLYP